MQPRRIQAAGKKPKSTKRILVRLQFPACILGLALVFSSTPLWAQLTGEQILEKVSETYRELKFFRSRYKYVGPGISEETKVVESRPGRVRLSSRTFLMVSNGETTWIYLPDLKQYTKMDAAPLLYEASRGYPSQRDYLSPYVDLAGQKSGVKLRGERRLRVGKKHADCYLIRIDRPGWRQTLFVDKRNFLVWRDDYLELPSPEAPGITPPSIYDITGSSQVGGSGNDLSSSTSTLKEMAPGPILDEEFQFVPPSGATYVAPMGRHIPPEPNTPDSPDWFINHVLYGFEFPAADFTLTDLDGKPVRLRDLRSRIVVLNFWASWCEPCRKEMSDIQKLSEELGGRDTVFLGIDDEDPETMRSFVKANGYKFTMLDDQKQAVHKLYDVRWSPVTIVIDRKGNITSTWLGTAGEAQLRKALEMAGLGTATP